MRFLAITIVLFLVACSDDVAGNDAQNCGPGESFNPINEQCELIRGQNNVSLNNENNLNNAANNANNQNNTDNGSAFFSPGSVDFEYTPVLEPGSLNVLLSSNTEAPLVIDRVEWEGATPNEFFALGIDEGVTIASLGSVSATLQFLPQDMTDDVVTLRVFFDNVIDPAVLTIDTTLIGADICSENCPRIQVSPPAVQISFQPNSPAIQQTIVIGSVGQANLEVTEVLLIQQGTAFSLQYDALPFDMRPQATKNLELTFNAAGPATGRILIRTNDPFTPEVEIPLSADSKVSGSDPCIVVAPTSLSFGTVQRGDVVVRSFNITNCGSTNLNVSQIERGSFFFIPTSQAYQLTSWTNGNISAGNSEVVEITYQPRRAGFDNGSFIVRSDSVDSPAITVNVSGTSEPPPIADQDIHIQVEWDSDETDVDTHVLLLPGQGLFCDNDCNFSNPEPDWGVPGDWQDDPFLDVDDVDGFGPENVNIEKGIDGMIYRVVLHYWRSGFDDSNVTVRLFSRGVLQQTWGPINLSSTGDTKNVFEIAWPSQTVTTMNDPQYSVPSSTSCRPNP